MSVSNNHGQRLHKVNNILNIAQLCSFQTYEKTLNIPKKIMSITGISNKTSILPFFLYHFKTYLSVKSIINEYHIGNQDHFV